MAFTEQQKQRIAFHLDYANSLNLPLALDKRITVDTVSAEIELAVIGNLQGASVDEIYVFHGVDLCTLTSALGKVERAYDKLSVDTIDDSLFVSKAGSVELRGNETDKRKNLYKLMVSFLAQELGALSDGGRVGF